VTLLSRFTEKANYGPLKQYFLRDLGISHQNIKMDSFIFKDGEVKGFASKISKLVLQMNAKIGGPLWIIPRPKEVPEDTMIIGIDIFHKLVANKESLIGFVASLDSDITQFYSTVKIQPKKGDVIAQGVKDCVQKAFEAYVRVNRRPP